MTDQARARRDDPATSHQAAASLPGEKLRASQSSVLEVIRRYGPMTDEALVNGYAGLELQLPECPRQSPSGLRTRRRELADKNLVHDTGIRSTLASGRKAIVWGYGPDPAGEVPATQSEPLALFP